MIMLDDFEQLKRKVEALRERKARADGAYQEHLKRLKKDYGVKSLEDAEKLLEEYKDKEHGAAAKYLRLRKAFDAEFKEALS
jgi:hypothetical protein